MAHKQDYIKKMELKKRRKVEAGVVSERFPEISNMVIHMTYFHDAHNPVLMERTVNVFPTSLAYFNMECMVKGCDNGGFDLTPVILSLIKHHKKLAKGNMICKGKVDEHFSSKHANISYEINIKYNKHSA
ncbi:MAG: hypothetical protein C4560_04085 [Nitrospiraceae bacterium]|nr:MAG: hypothetical protein C4560_04085 [Nitrospiraceae bacterium]